MRKFFCLIVLATFISITRGEAFAQTPTSAATFPQKEEVIELGETWPDTPLFTALRSEVEKVWIQNGESWFTREPNGALRQISGVSFRFKPNPDKMGTPDEKGWEGEIILHWRIERYFIPPRSQWTRSLGEGHLTFFSRIENGRLTVHQAGSQPRNFFKRSLPPFLNEIKDALAKPEMSEKETKGFVISAKARMTFLPPVDYTPEARKLRITGKVVLSVEVLADASLGRVAVVRSLGYGLDEKAIESVRNAKFTPAIELGAPIPAIVRVEVTFNID